MAWYRCGGGGIPSSLKTDMNTVYNKKFGTSTVYDPSVWASTANLMGPLPERTASGSIAAITDGADRVPIKSWEVEIAPTLAGKSAIECTQTGVNVLNTSAFETYSNWSTDLAPNGSYPTGNANRGFEIPVKSGVTYAVSFGMDAETFPTCLYLCRTDGSTSERLIYFSGANYSLSSGTFTAQSGWIYYFRLGSTGSEANFNTQISKLSFEQMEIGSTVSTYEPSNINVSTVNLGRTIYGGQADVVNGTGTDAYTIITVGNSGWTYYESGDNSYIFRTFNDKVTPQIGDTDHVLICDILPYGGVNYASQFQDLHIYQAANKNIYIKDTSCESANDYYQKYSAMKIGYELANPSTFTFDGITPTPETALGVNNFWADTGNSEVVYRADIDLLLGGN